MEKESVIQKIQKLQSNAESIGSTGEALNINNYNETDEHRIIRLLRERCEELGKYIQKQDEVMKIQELLIEKQSEFIDIRDQVIETLVKDSPCPPSAQKIAAAKVQQNSGITK